MALSEFSKNRLSQLPKADLFQALRTHDRLKLDDEEWQSTIIELANRLTTEASRLDKIRMVVLAGLKDGNLARLGLELMVNFVKDEADKGYWLALYQLELENERRDSPIYKEAVNQLVRLYKLKTADELSSVIGKATQEYLKLIEQVKKLQTRSHKADSRQG